MYPVYRSQDISTCPIFVSPVRHQLIRRHQPITHLEYMLGAGKSELRDHLDCTENILQVQPCMRKYFAGAVLHFLPSTATCEKMLKVAKHNVSCFPNERLLFSEIPEFDPNQCYYKLDSKDIRWDKKRLLYTRHPITGHVTTHTFPYPDLPTFSMSASPWMAAIAARPAFSVGNDYDLIPRIDDTLSMGRPPGHFQASLPSNVLQPPSVLECDVPRRRSSSKRTRRNQPYHPFAGSHELSHRSTNDGRGN